MYLLYIDDSGTCEIKKDTSYSIDGGNTRCFVLGGILVKAHELNRIENNIDTIRKGCLKNSLSEIKHSMNGNELNCSITCDKSIDKYCFKTNIANLINNIDCTVFATKQDKYFTTSNGIVASKDDIYRLCFEHLLKSVDTFMYNNKIKEDTIVFIDKKDSGSHKDTLIYNAYKEALDNSKIFKAFNNTIFSPTINVVYSQYTTGAQLADFIAGSVWEFFENTENKEKQRKAKIITQIYSSKVYSYNGKLIGLSFSDNFLK